MIEDKYILAEDYFKKHNRCPSCGCDNCEQTTGPIFETTSNPYRIKKDQNRAHCVCGWSGIVHDLVE